MVKISKITTQKRNKNRYNIFLDDGNNEEYGFSVDEDILIKYHLKKDLKLDKITIDTLIEQDSMHKSYAQVINYLSYRMRTEKEIRDYLKKKEVDSEHIIQIIEQLMKDKLVDDNEFAELFVRNRINLSTKGPSLVKQEIMQKGVSNEIASNAIEAFTYEVQYEKALDLGSKRMQGSNNHSHRKKLDQLRANLMRNGFIHEVISDVIAEIGEIDEDKEWDALLHHGERLSRVHESDENKIKEALYRQGFTMELIRKYLEKNLEE